MVLTIEDRLVGINQPPFVIAELSANHNGSLERALKIIDAAKSCGADAVKLQTYTADTMTIDCDDTDFVIKGGLWNGYKLYDLYKQAETPYEWHPILFAHARKQGIILFSTPFDESAVDLLESLNTPAYKIASFEVVDLPLIRYIASTGKPIIMSTGMASVAEIEEAVSTAREAGCRDLVLLHCISSYPTPIDQANLRKIPEITNRFGVLTGLSDHTHGTTVAVTAVAMGACVIEKHFTLSRADGGPDSQFSLEPPELERLCRDAKEAWLALGESGFEEKKVEESSRLLRRSLYFIKDLPADHVIKEGDVIIIRPGAGLAPKYLNLVLGSKLRTSVKRGTPVSMQLLQLR